MTLQSCAGTMTGFSLAVGSVVMGRIFRKVRGIHLGNYSAPAPAAPRQHVKHNEEY